MKTLIVLMGLLVQAGCDGMAPNAKTEPQKKAETKKEGSVAPDVAEEAKAVLKKALDDWVFGDATYKVDSDAEIRFADLEYNFGSPLTSYEIVAAKQLTPNMVDVAVRLVFPTRGGIHEIKKSVSYSVWKTEEGYWQTGVAVDASIRRAVSADSD